MAELSLPGTEATSACAGLAIPVAGGRGKIFGADSQFFETGSVADPTRVYVVNLFVHIRRFRDPVVSRLFLIFAPLFGPSFVCYWIFATVIVSGYIDRHFVVALRIISVVDFRCIVARDRLFFAEIQSIIITLGQLFLEVGSFLEDHCVLCTGLLQLFTEFFLVFTAVFFQICIL